MNFKFTRGRGLAELKPATHYRQFCQATLDRMSTTLAQGLEAHPQLVAVFQAMLLGQQYGLSEDQENWYTQSGTLHLFSISGLHIGVIALALNALLTLTRLPQSARFGITMVLLWLYVDVTGTSPSAVRSFVMVSCIHTAFLVRAPRSTISALSVSALIVLLIDPMQLFNASYQMSYGIVAALLVLGLPLAQYWEERWPMFADLPKATWSRRHHTLDALWRWTLGTTAIGLAASLVSTLTGILVFELFTPGSFAANLVLIPTASLALLAGFASLVVGLPGGMTLSLIFNHAAALVLAGIDAGLSFFVRIPGVYVSAKFSTPWVGSLAFAGLIALLLIGNAGAWSRHIGGFWPPFAYTALVLIFLVKFS